MPKALHATLCLHRIFTVVAILGLASAAPARSEPSLEPGDAAAATPWVELHAARARLLTSQAKAANGARLAGLEIALDDGWKTYWRMPGDAGVPPDLNWEGSTNVAAIKVLYPAPRRMQEAGGEVIGYKHEVLLPIEIAAQDPTKPVALKLALELGICREICIPATASFTLTIPPPLAARSEGSIAAAIARVPRPEAGRHASDPELKAVAIEGGNAKPRLTIAAQFHGAANADVFVEAPEGLYVSLPRKKAQGADGSVHFETELAGDVARDLKGKTLTLTLVSDQGATEARRTLP
ncbi:MAG TPA: protein-disulfide reductase DsbD domain-containing protein [Hyphomicrobiaceae bacterium]|nr:protein-disulfide reductase DsbD domain-containing protein [Hyphomicrobiaceae bacterium]